MASLGLSSLLPRHNGAGAPLVSPSVPVVWLQRKRQGILSHDRPSLRCGARSVMLSHSRKASRCPRMYGARAAWPVLCALEAALSICPNEPQEELPSAPQRAFFSAEQVHSWPLILRRILHAHARPLRAGDAGNGHSSFAGHMGLGKNANLL
ncbi:hypothetical protein LI328DRAFT_168932 [Trichoderma asperelloides]|nr:hypothetical protein LI328DRAFT_168932 [Trichoderma asperelloides]